MEGRNFCRIIVRMYDGKKVEVLYYCCFDNSYYFYYFLVFVGAQSNFGCKTSRKKIVDFYFGMETNIIRWNNQYRILLARAGSSHVHYKQHSTLLVLKNLDELMAIYVKID